MLLYTKLKLLNLKQNLAVIIQNNALETIGIYRHRYES